MRYARSDIHAFSGAPGCGGHTESAEDGPYFAVDCPLCDPVLALDPLWAGSVHEVPLTTAEQRVADDKQRQAEFLTAQWAQAMASAAAQNVAAQGAAPAAPAPAAEPKRTRKTTQSKA